MPKETRVAPYYVLAAVIFTALFAVPYNDGATLATSPTVSNASPSTSVPAASAGGRILPPPHIINPPPPPPPQTTRPPIFPVNPPHEQFINPIPNPLDVTHDVPAAAQFIPVTELAAISGIADLKSFPSSGELKGPTNFILVQTSSPEDAIQRESPYLVNVIRGHVLASVRKPSEMGMIHTPVADIAFSANSDSFIDSTGNVVRIRNVDGLRQALKVQIKTGPHAGTAVSVSPGYELVVSDHKMNREELRPNDGILRRKTQLLQGGTIAVSQYEVETALQQSTFLPKLEQQVSTDVRARRILNDMSRMAAVLNQLNGTNDFSR